MTREKEYQRLPGRGRQVGIAVRTFTRLYLGRDHLLNVTSTGWTENYRRYYLADIQSVVVCKTKRAFIWNLILGGLTAIFGALLFYGLLENVKHTSSFYAGAWVIGSLAALLGIFLIVNLLRGPSCRATIQTPASREPLHSLHRLRTAEKVLAILQPAITQAQGALDPADLPARLAEIARTAPARIIPGRGLAGTHYLRHAGYRGQMHRWTFVAAHAAAALSVADLFLQKLGLILASMVAIATLAVYAIMAVVRQHESNTSPAVRRVTWAALAFAAVYFFGSYLVMVFASVQHPNIMNNQWLMLQNAVAIRGVRLSLDLFTAIGCFLLGLIGLILTMHPKTDPPNTP